jgi:hypothetical protein
MLSSYFLLFSGKRAFDDFVKFIETGGEQDLGDAAAAKSANDKDVKDEL